MDIVGKDELRCITQGTSRLRSFSLCRWRMRKELRSCFVQAIDFRKIINLTEIYIKNIMIFILNIIIIVVINAIERFIPTNGFYRITKITLRFLLKSSNYARKFYLFKRFIKGTASQHETPISVHLLAYGNGDGSDKTLWFIFPHWLFGLNPLKKTGACTIFAALITNTPEMVEGLVAYG